MSFIYAGQCLLDNQSLYFDGNVNRGSATEQQFLAEVKPIDHMTEFCVLLYVPNTLAC